MRKIKFQCYGTVVSLLLFLAYSSHAYNVAITGATGRVGRLVVDSCLKAGHSVTAIVRNGSKAKEILPDTKELYIKCLNLENASDDDISNACSDCDRLIWCASGFYKDKDDVDQSIDVRGMSMIKSFDSWKKEGDESPQLPSVIMISSAGVTRPDWDDEKKARLVGCADIPIIRLNPGNILGKKCEAEKILRFSGLPYCIVRPTGLKFEDWPRGRPILSQGDVAVGRTNPYDLADTVVDLLSEQYATGKTFELFTVAGYPKPRSISQVLERLKIDDDELSNEAAITATYNTLQQLLPGEEQDATKLEMGRTYEQLDTGVVEPRKRGVEPTSREKELASSVVGDGGTKRQRVGNFFGRLIRKH